MTVRRLAATAAVVVLSMVVLAAVLIALPRSHKAAISQPCIPVETTAPEYGQTVFLCGEATSESSEPEQGLANGDVVDNIRVGTATDCATDPDCATRTRLAKDAAIERHGLAPSAIGAARFYLPYLPPGAARGTGGFRIIVFDLEDGSQAAVNTFCMDNCMVISPQPLQPLTLEGTSDHGPQVDPLAKAPRNCASADHPTCSEAVQVAIDSATTSGFLTPDTIADAHYDVIYITPGSPEAAASKAEYIVDIYVAGPQDVLAETAIGVYCGSGSCEVVP